MLKVDFMRVEVHITSSLCLGFLCKDVQLELGRFSWTGLIFELNRETISTTSNNGILKWGERSIDLCMTNCKLKLNSKEIIFLFNEVHKIYLYLESRNFDLVQFVKEEAERADDQGRVMPT